MRVKLIACPVVLEELLAHLPAEGVEPHSLDMGLHASPERLKVALQEAVDGSEPHFDAVVLGYGLCSKAVVGVVARHSRLVVPRVDDCISLFLGSRAAYRGQLRAEPGTYYLTRGWIDAGQGPFAEYERMCERWGAQRADRLMAALLKHYTRLALIRTGRDEALAPYRRQARETAARFGLRYEELDGSTALLEKLARGPWGEDFVVVSPGDCVPFEPFCSGSAGPPASPRPVSSDAQRHTQDNKERNRHER